MDNKLFGMLQKVKKVSREYAALTYHQRQSVLNELADQLQVNANIIIQSNAEDLKKLAQTDPKYDRLLLTLDRLNGIIRTIKAVAQRPDPLHHILETYHHPLGMLMNKISVPLGVVAIIYESRPNVTIDAFILSFMAGNACLLKGSHEADHSNKALVDIIHEVLISHHISPDGVLLLPSARSVVQDLCYAQGLVDVIIPRGGNNLIQEVREHARVPVIETGAGVVHIYFDQAGDVNIGRTVLTNAKTRRVSVCNAVDCLVIHENRLSELALLTENLKQQQVEIFADAASYKKLDKYYPHALLQHATDEHYGMEFLSLKLAIKTVASFDAAIDHICHYSSGHSEAIITSDISTRDAFLQQIDAAAVYVNSSTAFTDGEEFGMGSEIGISTQKLHVRGPFSMQHLTTMKWLIYGEGQVRER